MYVAPISERRMEEKHISEIESVDVCARSLAEPKASWKTSFCLQHILKIGNFKGFLFNLKYWMLVNY